MAPIGEVDQLLALRRPQSRRLQPLPRLRAVRRVPDGRDRLLALGGRRSRSEQPALRFVDERDRWPDAPIVRQRPQLPMHALVGRAIEGLVAGQGPDHVRRRRAQLHGALRRKRAWAGRRDSRTARGGTGRDAGVPRGEEHTDRGRGQQGDHQDGDRRHPSARRPRLRGGLIQARAVLRRNLSAPGLQGATQVLLVEAHASASSVITGLRATRARCRRCRAAFSPHPSTPATSSIGRSRW